MDKIWYRNPLKSEVIGCCGGDEKTKWPSRTDKSRTLKKYIKKILKILKTIKFGIDRVKVLSTTVTITINEIEHTTEGLTVL